MIKKLKLLQRIGESVCEGCGFSSDCGIEPLKCQRMNSAIAALDKYVNAENENTGNKSASVTGSISRWEKEGKAWESLVLWPDEVSTGNDPNVSTDKHDTAEMAISVCDALKKEGLGGEGKIFPLDTYVRPVWNSEKK